MKRLIHLIICILFTIPLLGQITISVEPSYLLTGKPSDIDVTYYLKVTNSSPVDIGVLWARDVESAPSQWITWICDKNLCYTPSSDASNPNKPNILAPGEQFDLQIHVNPVLTEGISPYDITFYDYSDPEVVLAHVEGTVIIGNSVSTNENSNSKGLSVFPNPTTDFFQVNGTPGLKSIELFNIIGNKVRSFTATPQKQYYVGDLNDGIYLVRMISASNEVLKTIRLSKR